MRRKLRRSPRTSSPVLRRAYRPALNWLGRSRRGQSYCSTVNGKFRARHWPEFANAPGITSEIFRNLYGDVLVFHRWDEKRITEHTPVTSRWDRLP